MIIPAHWDRNVPLAPLTSWRIGGPAEYLVRPLTADELRQDIRCAIELDLPIYVLGRGTNVLIDDAGLPGLVVNLRRIDSRSLRIDSRTNELVVGGAVAMPWVARRACAAGLDGFTFLAGIPGTLGAGIAINAGTSVGGAKSMSSVLERVKTLDTSLTLRSFDAPELGLGYRTSEIPRRRLLVLSARLRIPGHRSPARLRAELVEHLASRAARQPVEEATAGSTFRQPAGERAAGWYLEKAGMKGRVHGRAKVSERHANWIVNLGGATASDVRALISLGRERVYRDFNVELQPEIVDLRELPWRHRRSAVPTR